MLRAFCVALVNTQVPMLLTLFFFRMNLETTPKTVVIGREHSKTIDLCLTWIRQL